MEEKTALLQVPEKLRENVENSILQERDINVIGNATSNSTKDPTPMKKLTSSRKPLPTALAVETNNGETHLVQKQVFHSGVPVKLFSSFKQTTTVKPFSFEERNNAAQKRKQEKLQKIREEAEKQQCTTFHARPVPAYLKHRI